MFEKKISLEQYQKEINNLKQEQKDNINELIDFVIQNQNQTSKKLDSVYQNALTRMGTIGDPQEHTQIKAFSQYAMPALDNLYTMDPLIRKIINIRVNYVFKERFHFESPDREYQDNFFEIFDGMHDLTKKFKLAYKYGLIHGDGFLLINSSKDFAKKDRFEYHISPSTIKDISDVSVLSRYFLAAMPEEIDFQFNPEYYYVIQQPLVDYNANASFEKSSKPIFDFSNKESYNHYLNTIPKIGTEKIHRTHMLGFYGCELMPYTFRSNLHFNDSYIRQIYNACKNYNAVMDSLTQMLIRIPFPVYKMEGLNNKLDNAQTRQRLADLMAARERLRAQNNITVTDVKEDYSWYTPTLAGIADLVEKAKDRVCIDSDITHDVLLNEGSHGQTMGRSEKTTFQSSIDIERENQVKPKIFWFMKAFQSAYGLKIPKKIQIEFGHHEESTDKENAEIFVSFANAVSTLENLGYDCSTLIKEKYPQVNVDKIVKNDPDEDSDTDIDNLDNEQNKRDLDKESQKDNDSKIKV